jgi:hypothetical protein
MQAWTYEDWRCPRRSATHRSWRTWAAGPVPPPDDDVQESPGSGRATGAERTFREES